jgi:hypothetical protein
MLGCLVTRCTNLYDIVQCGRKEDDVEDKSKNIKGTRCTWFQIDSKGMFNPILYTDNNEESAFETTDWIAGLA